MPFRTQIFPVDSSGLAAMVTWARINWALGFRLQAVQAVKDGPGAYPRILLAMLNTAGPQAASEPYRLALATNPAAAGNVTYPVAGSYVPGGGTSPSLSAALDVLDPGDGTRAVPWVVPLETGDTDQLLLLLSEEINPANADQQGTMLARVPITHVELTASATSQQFTVLANAQPGAYLLWTNLGEAFTGGTSTDVRLDVGPTSNPDLLVDNLSIYAGAIQNYAPQAGDLGATIVTLQELADIVATFTSTGDDVDALTTGDTVLELWRVA